MKILLLADLNSVHTIKWVKGLLPHKIDIVAFGLQAIRKENLEIYKDVKTYSYDFSLEAELGNGAFKKLAYLKVIPYLRKVVRDEKPDILHAHYASSYGLLGALCNIKPFIISVWGSDVYDFPLKSWLHKKVLQFSLSKADKILSTSCAMKKETLKYTNKPIEVTPFGVDMKIFQPKQKGTASITIGTIKALESKYGVEYLIKAFGVVAKKYPELSLELLIVGTGSLLNTLKKLAVEENIDAETTFTGRVEFEKIPDYHNKITIFVAASILDSESFGVAVVEASACATPVVVSNVGGLPEVVSDGVTGIVVEKENVLELANAIELLVKNETLRVELGENGRRRAEKSYNWENNIQQMIDIYKESMA